MRKTVHPEGLLPALRSSFWPVPLSAAARRKAGMEDVFPVPPDDNAGSNPTLFPGRRPFPHGNRIGYSALRSWLETMHNSGKDSQSAVSVVSD